MPYVYFWNPSADLSVRIHDWLCARHEPPLFCVSDKPTLDKLNDLLLPEQGRPVTGVSVKFRHILRTRHLAPFDQVVNLHNGFLPWNRGAHPNVWPIVDGSPAGVTLHQMDEGIDTGPILAQDWIPTDAHDTAETLYRRLDDAAFRLFTDHWAYLGMLPVHPQRPGGSVHRVEDLGTINDPTNEAHVRARTFTGYEGLT